MKLNSHKSKKHSRKTRKSFRGIRKTGGIRKTRGIQKYFKGGNLSNAASYPSSYSSPPPNFEFNPTNYASSTTPTSNVSSCKAKMMGGRKFKRSNRNKKYRGGLGYGFLSGKSAASINSGSSGMANISPYEVYTQ